MRTEVHLYHTSTISFNPRIRDGCEYATGFLPVLDAVSIHASVMDAKNFLTEMDMPKAVSIHASVMDANHIQR